MSNARQHGFNLFRIFFLCLFFFACQKMFYPRSTCDSPKNGLIWTHFCWLSYSAMCRSSSLSFCVHIFCLFCFCGFWLKHVFVKCRSNIRNSFVVRWYHNTSYMFHYLLHLGRWYIYISFFGSCCREELLWFLFPVSYN